MRSSTAVGLAAARGRFTSMPRYIIGAVSMKISSSTSTTSTSGMMLISAIDVPMRRSPPPSGDGRLNAIFGRPRQLRYRAAQDVQEIQHEAVHLRRPVPHPIDEVVVADDRRDGGREARRGGNQRFRDTRRHDGQA